MELGSSFNTKDLRQGDQQHEEITASDASSRESATRSATRSARSARTACNEKEAKFARSPGIKILEMAGKVPEYHSKFSVKEFKLRNQTFVEEASDEYDTDLESDVAPRARKAYMRDTTGKEIYLEACRHFDVIPVSYFTRNISSQVVNLGHHGLGANGVKAIVVALLTNTKICELDLQDNAICDESGKDVASMFLDNFYITKLNLASNHLGLSTSRAFSDSLEGNGTLRVLDLSGNQLCDKSIEILSFGIMSNYSLTELNLSKNKITEKGGKFIGAMLNEQRSLVNLDLSWNGLGPSGSEAVLKGLNENIILQNLNLAWNAIGAEGCRAISRAMSYVNLLCLDISNNRLLAEGARKLSQGLKRNTLLETLKIGQNILESPGICIILKAILQNTESKIKTLDISGTDLEQDFYEIEKDFRDSNRTIKFIHETKFKEKAPKPLTDPREILKKFLDDNGIHKLDLFDFIDRDSSMAISVEEFKQGLKATKCGLADFQIDELMDILDKDHDGEIDYSEFADL